jgi:uncharacterized protein involved in exopolysaccharide biosynthesis
MVVEKNSNTEKDDAIPELDILKFDKKIFLIMIARKIYIPIISAFILLIFAFVAASLLLSPKWEAITTIYRQPRNDTVETNLPILFGKVNEKTVVRTITRDKNLRRVIKETAIKIEPGELSRQINVDLSRDKIITIKVTSDKQENPAKIANALAQAFLDGYLEDQSSGAHEVYKQYLKIAENLKESLAIQEKKLQAFLKEHNIISIESETNLKFQQMNDLELKLLEKKMKLTSLKLEIGEINKLVKNMQADTVQSYVVTSSNKAALNSLETELDYLREKFTDENPKVKSLLDRLHQMKIQLKSSKGVAPPSQKTYGPNAVKNTFELRKLNAEMEIKSTTKGIIELQESIARLNKQLIELSKIKDPYLQLQREINSQKDVLEKIKAIVTESKILMDSKICDFAILEKAVTPKFPLPSKKKIIAVAAGFLGFAFAFAAILVIVFLDFTFKSTTELEDILDIPVIGTIPDKDALSPKIYYPAYQIFFDNFISFFEKIKHSPAMLVVTSNTPGTGKSFIVEQIIAQLTKSGKKILYIDTIQNVSDNIKDSLINGILFHNEDRSQINIHNSSNLSSRLYLDISKRTITNSLDKKTIEHFKSLFPEFDMIIFETFPCSDNIQMFCNIAFQADLTLFVAGFRKSDRRHLKAAVKFLQNKNLKNMAVMLNRVEKKYFVKEV